MLVLDDPSYIPEQYKAIAAASFAQLDACLAHPHTACTYLSPPALRADGGLPPTTPLADADGISRISVEDLAVAVLDELEQPGTPRPIVTLRRGAE
jgi:putative NADH-flavin reductase